MEKIFKNKTTPGLSIFTTAGFPTLNSLNSQLELLNNMNVDFVEVGIPFSDPMADGPVIQASSMKALKNGMNLTVLFEQLAERTTEIPIILMGYLNPVLQFGLEKFLTLSHENNVSGFVLPDLSAELYESKYQSIFEKHNIPVCFLVTPKTADERIIKAAKLSAKGFIYLVSSNSTTGGSQINKSELSERYQEIKSLCGTTPVVIGFGIRDKSSFRKATKGLDGGIIGSAFIKALENQEENSFLKELST